MQNQFDIGIVIPCFNEEHNFLHESYVSFLRKNTQTIICFVNDGSTDNTLKTIQELQAQFHDTVMVLDLTNNQGKAEAVRKGMNHLNDTTSLHKIGFIDADLAVSLEESEKVASLVNSKISMAFGSRISRVGAQIDRQFYRFIIGRFIATIISNILHLKVYDTQCGCKFFDPKVAKELFQKGFISKWVFDVELFFRMQQQFGKEVSETKMYEFPLIKWVDRGDSKVQFSYGFKVFFDLLSIRNAYKN